jgi:hypothetical protein
MSLSLCAGIRNYQGYLCVLAAVVISLVLIFIADFALSFLFFQGQGDALKQCM